MDELTYIAARFIKLTRYYDLILTRDLFGWVVVKAYGRRGTQLGRMNTLPFDGLVAKIEDVSEVPIWVPLFMRKFRRY